MLLQKALLLLQKALLLLQKEKSPPKKSPPKDSPHKNDNPKIPLPWRGGFFQRKKTEWSKTKKSQITNHKSLTTPSKILANFRHPSSGGE